MDIYGSKHKLILYYMNNYRHIQSIFLIVPFRVTHTRALLPLDSAARKLYQIRVESNTN